MVDAGTAHARYAGFPTASEHDGVAAAFGAASQTRRIAAASLALAAALVLVGQAASAWRTFDHDLSLVNRPSAVSAPALPRVAPPPVVSVDPRRAALMDLLGRLRASADPDAADATARDPQSLLADAQAAVAERAGRLRSALKLIGVKPRGGAETLGVSGDPKALATMLNVDEDFARRIRDTARAIGTVEAQEETIERLPLAAPVENVRLTSGFGVRSDPFTEQHAFHAGQDFGGGYMTPIHATAPGVVSFTGDRTGYGHVVEVDHGGGLKTRYAHLAAIGVRVGQAVDTGARLGGMGSTGRSTGTHLHYEVWKDGKVQNPTRFLKAGQMLGVQTVAAPADTSPEQLAPTHHHGRVHHGRGRHAEHVHRSHGWSHYAARGHHHARRHLRFG